MKNGVFSTATKLQVIFISLTIKLFDTYLWVLIIMKFKVYEKVWLNSVNYMDR